MPVHDQQPGHLLLRARPDLPVTVPDAVSPKEQVPDREALVHRIEQIAHLAVRPYKWALDLRQADFPHLDVLDEFGEVVADFFEKCDGHK